MTMIRTGFGTMASTKRGACVAGTMQRKRPDNLAERLKTMTCHELAEELGVRPSTVQHWAAVRGIQRLRRCVECKVLSDEISGTGKHCPPCREKIDAANTHRTCTSCRETKVKQAFRKGRNHCNNCVDKVGNDPDEPLILPMSATPGRLTYYGIQGVHDVG